MSQISNNRSAGQVQQLPDAQGPRSANKVGNPVTSFFKKIGEGIKAKKNDTEQKAEQKKLVKKESQPVRLSKEVKDLTGSGKKSPLGPVRDQAKALMDGVAKRKTATAADFATLATLRTEVDCIADEGKRLAAKSALNTLEKEMFALPFKKLDAGKGLGLDKGLQQPSWENACKDLLESIATAKTPQEMLAAKDKLNSLHVLYDKISADAAIDTPEAKELNKQVKETFQRMNTAIDAKYDIMKESTQLQDRVRVLENIASALDGALNYERKYTAKQAKELSDLLTRVGVDVPAGLKEFLKSGQDHIRKSDMVTIMGDAYRTLEKNSFTENLRGRSIDFAVSLSDKPPTLCDNVVDGWTLQKKLLVAEEKRADGVFKLTLARTNFVMQSQMQNYEKGVAVDPEAMEHVGKNAFKLMFKFNNKPSEMMVNTISSINFCTEALQAVQKGNINDINHYLEMLPVLCNVQKGSLAEKYFNFTMFEMRKKETEFLRERTEELAGLIKSVDAVKKNYSPEQSAKVQEEIQSAYQKMDEPDNDDNIYNTQSKEFLLRLQSDLKLLDAAKATEGELGKEATPAAKEALAKAADLQEIKDTVASLPETPKTTAAKQKLDAVSAENKKEEAAQIKEIGTRAEKELQSATTQKEVVDATEKVNGSVDAVNRGKRPVQATEDQKVSKEQAESVKAEHNAKAAEKMLSVDSVLKEVLPLLNGAQSAALSTLLVKTKCSEQLLVSVRAMDKKELADSMQAIWDAKTNPTRENLDKAYTAVDSLSVDRHALEQGALDFKLFLTPPDMHEATTQQHVNTYLKHNLFTALGAQDSVLLQSCGISSPKDMDVQKLHKLTKQVNTKGINSLDMLICKTFWNEFCREVSSTGNTPRIEEFKRYLPDKFQGTSAENLKTFFRFNLNGPEDFALIKDLVDSVQGIMRNLHVLALDSIQNNPSDRERCLKALDISLHNKMFSATGEYSSASMSQARPDMMFGWAEQALGLANSDPQKRDAAALQLYREMQNYEKSSAAIGPQLDLLLHQEDMVNAAKNELAVSLTDDQKGILKNQKALDKNGHINFNKIKGETLSWLLLGLADVSKNDGGKYGDVYDQHKAFRAMKLPAFIHLESMQTASSKLFARTGSSDSGMELATLVKKIRDLNPKDSEFETKFAEAKKNLDTFMEGRKGLLDNARFILQMKNTEGAGEKQKIPVRARHKMTVSRGAKDGTGFAALEVTSSQGKDRHVKVKMADADKATEYGIKKALFEAGSHESRKIQKNLAAHFGGIRAEVSNQNIGSKVFQVQKLYTLRQEEKLLNEARKELSDSVLTFLDEASDTALLLAFTTSAFNKFAEAENSLRTSTNVTETPFFAKAVDIMVETFGVPRSTAVNTLLAKTLTTRKGLDEDGMVAQSVNGALDSSLVGRAVNSHRKSLLTRIVDKQFPSPGVLNKQRELFNKMTAEEHYGLFLATVIDSVSQTIGKLEPGDVATRSHKVSVQAGIAGDAGIARIGLAAKATVKGDVVFSRTENGDYQIMMNRNASTGIGASISAFFNTLTLSGGVNANHGDGLVFSFKDKASAENFMAAIVVGSWSAADMGKWCSDVKTYTENGLGATVSLQCSTPNKAIINRLSKAPMITGKVSITGNLQEKVTRDRVKETKTVNSQVDVRFGLNLSIGLVDVATEEEIAANGIKTVGSEAAKATSAKAGTGSGKWDASIGLSDSSLLAALEYSGTMFTSQTRSERDDSVLNASIGQKISFGSDHARTLLCNYCAKELGMSDSNVQALWETLQQNGASNLVLTVSSSLTSEAKDAINAIKQQGGPDAETQVQALLEKKSSYGDQRITVNMNIAELTSSIKLPAVISKFVNIESSVGKSRIFSMPVKPTASESMARA